MIQVYMDIRTKRLLLMSLMGGIVSGVVITGIALLFLNNNAQVLQAGTTESSGSYALVLAREEATIDTIDKAKPAVVSISATREIPLMSDYDEFFDNSYNESSYEDTEEIEVGGGTGFFVSSDGYIVTNRHVVEDEGAEYTVLTNDGKEHMAEVVARDDELDIAILKISVHGYPYLKFGNSDKIEIGQSVIAIGNALGEFRNTVSVGIISGLGRSIVAGDFMGRSEALYRLIQTDAAINHGNSGGPLLDMQGNVIGVNVAVASMAQNISFALPANDVKEIVDSIRR